MPLLLHYFTAPVLLKFKVSTDKKELACDQAQQREGGQHARQMCQFLQYYIRVQMTFLQSDFDQSFQLWKLQV